MQIDLLVRVDAKVLFMSSCDTLFALYKPQLSQNWMHLVFKRLRSALYQQIIPREYTDTVCLYLGGGMWVTDAATGAKHEERGGEAELKDIEWQRV